jgi:hypothetical protein
MESLSIHGGSRSFPLVSEAEPDPLQGLLSGFALGPAWARPKDAKGAAAEQRPAKGPAERPHERGDRFRNSDAERGGNRFQGNGKRPGAHRRDMDRPVPEALPAEGVRVTILPDPQAVKLIGKEIHQVARVYSLYDIARTIVAERTRCRARFEVNEGLSPLLQGKLDSSLFLSREDALRHLWQSPLRDRFLEERTVEVEAPAVSVQVVARCGLSGEWLGPPNFHDYQPKLRRLHAERYAHLPFEVYASKVRTERGEEAVNAWLDTMRTRREWRFTGDADDAWIPQENEARRQLSARAFDQAFEETRAAELPAALPAGHASAGLMASLKEAGLHARNHPAVLIPAVCRALEAERIPVFKRQGKLFSGPARPKPLPADTPLAARPALMVGWIRANKPAKLEGLWKAVLPEGGTAPSADFAADLFWMLTQGHILLFQDDTLVMVDGKSDGGERPTAGAGNRSKNLKVPAIQDSQVPEAADEAIEEPGIAVDDSLEAPGNPPAGEDPSSDAPDGIDAGSPL